MTISEGKDRILELIKEKGLIWTISYVIKYTVKNKILDKSLSKKLEKGKELVDLPSHSVAANKQLWNEFYDWSEMGDEWTLGAEKYKGIDPKKWKSDLVNNMLQKYIKKDSNVLEIGPGGGRWTELLQKISKKLILVDISPKCLDICKKRFLNSDNIEYNVIKKNLEFLDDSTVDYIWSYDVFVHINPSTIKNYISDFKRILKPNGIAIIHHSGKYLDYTNPKEGWRSFFGKEEFEKLVTENNLSIKEQNTELPHLPGDVITVISKS